MNTSIINFNYQKFIPSIALKSETTKTLLPASNSIILSLIKQHHNYRNITGTYFTMCSSPNRSKEKTCSFSTTKTSSSSTTNPSIQIQDIEDIHTQATQAKSKTYTDPSTGFTVFTEYAHLKRGKCCGNICRHCPYGWENVSYKKNGELVRRQAKVQSGDKEGVEVLLNRIENGEYVSLLSSSECQSNNENIVHENKENEDAVNTDIDLPKNNGVKKYEQSNDTCIKPIINRGEGGRKGGTLTGKNVPYTRTGDEGTSMLLTGERRTKDDITFEAMGTVDELCSVVGVAQAELIATIKFSLSSSIEKGKNIDYGELPEWLLETMSRLFDVGSHVAKPKSKQFEDDEEDCDLEQRFTPDGIGGGFDEIHINTLEVWIDVMTEQLPELTSFVLPTGGKASAQLHLARCVCRRAERRVLPLVREGVCDPNVLRYLNRLSDFFFTAARWTNFCEGKEEVQYKRYFKGASQRGMVTVNLRDEKKFPN